MGFGRLVMGSHIRFSRKAKGWLFLLAILMLLLWIALVVFVKTPSTAWQELGKGHGKLPQLSIEILPEHWRVLVAQRQALQRKVPDSEEEQQLTAVLYFQGRRYQSEIRLQDELIEYSEAVNGWPLLIQLEQGQSLLSSRRFTLNRPSAIYHQGPQLFSQTLQKAGFEVLAPSYIPFRVSVNGKDWGVMYLHQLPSMEMTTLKNRSQGVIAYFKRAMEKTEEQSKSPVALRPAVLEAERVSSSVHLARQRTIALTLLSDFLNNKRMASDVFDADKLGQYLATVDVWSAWQAFKWDSWRWYYNPHTAKLEPVQNNAGIAAVDDFIQVRAVSDEFPLVGAMLSDPLIYSRYRQSLLRLSGLLQTRILQDHLLSQTVGNAAQYDFSAIARQANCLVIGHLFEPCRSLPSIPAGLYPASEQLAGISNSEIASDEVGFLPRPSMAMNLDKYPFIQVAAGTWSIAAGQWKIDDYLVTPSDWRVNIAAGAELRFAKGAGLMVFGSLNINGTETEPVRLTAQQEQPWSGISVFGDGRASRLSSVVFEHVGRLERGSWRPRGGLNFINSRLVFNNLKVTNSDIQDLLNIVDSRVEVNGVRLKDQELQMLP